MKLTHTQEVFRPIKQGGKNVQQVITVQCKAESRDELDELSYRDFEFILEIDGKVIGDIGHILSKLNDNAFRDICDNIDWSYELYLAQEAREQDLTDSIDND